MRLQTADTGTAANCLAWTSAVSPWKASAAPTHGQPRTLEVNDGLFAVPGDVTS